MIDRETYVKWACETYLIPQIERPTGAAVVLVRRAYRKGVEDSNASKGQIIFDKTYGCESLIDLKSDLNYSSNEKYELPKNNHNFSKGSIEIENDE